MIFSEILKHAHVHSAHKDSPSIEWGIVIVLLNTMSLILDVFDTLTDAQEMTSGCYVWHWTMGTEDYVWELLNKRLVSFSLSYVDLHSYGQFKHDIRIIKKITYCQCTSNCNAKNKTKQMLMKFLFQVFSRKVIWSPSGFHFQYLSLLAWYLQTDTDEKEILMGYLR